MTVKLIASDLDGTLLRPDHRLSAFAIDVLRTAKQAGLRVVAATGRGPMSTRPVLEGALDGDIDMALASNGAVVLDLKNDRVVERFPIDADLAAKFIDVIRRQLPDAAIAWECEGGFGWEERFRELAPRLDELDLLVAAGGSFAPFDPDDDITKLLVAHPTLIKKELMTLIAELAPELVATSSGVDFVEVSGAGVDKAHGLRHLCAEWNIDARDVIAFGDNWNDIAMLEWAGTGIAMGHAHEDVQQVADVVIGSNADDAVAHHIATLL